MQRSPGKGGQSRAGVRERSARHVDRVKGRRSRVKPGSEREGNREAKLAESCV